MTTALQDMFEEYTHINALQSDDWLLSEISRSIITQPEEKSRLVLPRLAPRLTDSIIIQPTLKRFLNEQDEKIIKRQRNTNAARRSRLKKSLKMDALEKRVAYLTSENYKMATHVAVLESEKNQLQSKDRSLEERIRELEKQLSEAHQLIKP